MGIETVSEEGTTSGRVREGAAPGLRLRLFVARGAPYSVVAEATVRRVCAERAGGDVDLQVIDVVSQPAEAVEHNVFITPTLIRVSPEPEARLAGSLGEEERIREFLAVPT